EQLEASLAVQRAQLHDLATMGAVITSIQEIESVLSVVMDMAIRLVDGEVGIIYLADRDRLDARVSWGISDELIRAIKIDDGRDLASYCYQEREGAILTDLEVVGSNGVRINSVLCLPIKVTAACLGVMVIVNKVGGGPFTERDKEALGVLLNFVAVAIENSNLVRDKLTRQAMEQEMLIARQIQETILPGNIANIPGVEIGAVYFPAREVGGDFYDIVKIDEARFYVVIGDVSNKGVPAALVMSASSGIIKSILETSPEIQVNELAAKLNDLLVSGIIKAREMFVTLFFARFDLDSRTISYCNAGHLPGLLWRHETKTIETLSEGGPIVGQFPGFAFKVGERTLASGDRLFLYTDGLTEAADQAGNLFGRARAEEVFRREIGLQPGEFCTQVKTWVDKFTVGAADESHDDFTVVQVRVL
ncbi:MAG: SpoIIE family protein phosphatase, partial [candidate division Zixibacteria bacterium]|nr:SpoIIE family protein phosphatase [candidate division Zixibacteria bacterium]